MAVQDWSTNPDLNTSIDGTFIGEFCPPGNMNDMGRRIMAAVKSWYDNAPNGAELTGLQDAIDALTQDMTDVQTFLNPARAKQLLHANAYLLNDHSQGVVNIGDSISHGAYSGNAYTNHWVYLLARAIGVEFGNGLSIGEYPMEAVYNSIPALNTKQIADVVFSGTDWGALGSNPAPYNYPVGNIGAGAANIVNGKSYSSSVNGATITLTLPTIGRAMAFKYTQQPAGGQFTISVNGVVGATVNTAGTHAYNVNTVQVPLTDNGNGECVVVITKIDANATEINSLFNLKTDNATINDLNNRMQVHNYSQSGRLLLNMSESAIIKACDSVALIVSLGINDQDPSGGNTDADNTNFAAFQQRINWLIQYAQVYRCLVVVQDFIWYAPASSRTRQELKRLAQEVRGIYIPYPENFFADGGNPTSTPLQLNDPMHLWADAAHPGPLGNELIFATLATAMGLTVNSKRIALAHHDWAYPVKITSADLKNASPIYPGSLTTIQQDGDYYRLRVNLAPTGASFAQNTLINAFTALPEKFRNGALNLLGITQATAINPSTGASQTFAIWESPETLHVYTNQTGQTLCRGIINDTTAV